MNLKHIAGALFGTNLISSASVPAISALSSDDDDDPGSRKNNKHIKNTKVKKDLLLNINVTNDLLQGAVVVTDHSNSAIFNNITSGPVNSYLTTGELLTLIKKEGSFYKVEVDKTGAIGYISTSNVKLIESGLKAEFIENLSNAHIVNAAKFIHFRKAPDVHSETLEDLKNNFCFEVLGKQGQWFKAKVNDKIGYIYETYVEVESTLNSDSNFSIISANVNVS